MKRIVFALGLLLATPVQAQDAPVIHLPQGDLRGQTQDGISRFKAIPFAAPPVAEARWTAPRVPQAWPGVRDATKSAPACAQVSYGWNEKAAEDASEDCLYLEVATPELRPVKPLPVMVFIHGGANRAGDGAGTVHSALPSQGVVLVSIQYRLGVFGFLSHPALSAEQGGASGNYALMDQIAALRWVRDHIAAFGGDPKNVTLFGHSAGAQNVGLLLAAPAAKRLFHKAILQSGTPQFGLPPRTLTQNEALGTTLARGFSGAKPDSAAALADLRRADARDLQAAADRLDAPIDDDSFIWLQPTVDGKVLPRAPQTVFRAGEGADIPVIIGVSARELGLHGTLKSQLKAAFGPRAKAAAPYYRRPDPVLGPPELTLATDLSFRCPADWLARQRTAKGGRVWLYQLEVNRPADQPVHHGSELTFVFNRPPVGEGPGWPDLGARWVHFARDGTPGADWPTYGAKARSLRLMATGPQVATHLRGPVCGWLDRP
ncbi:carboxylesterase/lipase family protein [Asticcacaulis excentricus]|uniref:Carboxylic ester hydrolase n=1 Tax=Asticcacaulis excentricus (strain ATCC 15261 / DSM 4724 / KCTC 12464 / NCIMB 9791 / VKM B-1370 / CB 48) TaxID=573065 RepID=E8RKL9_ASTEC|nr:carboxylesterase family protein [Asticcacaulis excentricus]ADU13553.1 Carboxylesterase type B [Asticcacaulis excentricus CB 48]